MTSPLPPWTRWGFVAAAGYNFGILGVTYGLNNPVLFDADPTVWSAPSSILVMLWGLAYLSLARDHEHARWTVLVFAIEKALYGALWLRYLLADSTDLAAITAQDPLTGVFLGAYGAGDLLFCAFFAWVFFRLTR